MKFFGSGLLALIMVSSNNLPALASSSGCQQIGLKKQFNSKSFQCMKKGKKKIWVEVKRKSKKKSPAIAEVEKNPSVQAPNSNSENTISKNDSTTVPITSQANQPLQISLENLDTQEVQFKAYTNVMDAVLNSEKRKPKLIIEADPAISNEWINAEIERLNKIYSLLYPVFKPAKVELIYWLNSNSETARRGQDWYDAKASRGAYSRILINELQQGPCNGAFAQSFFDRTTLDSTEVWLLVTCSEETGKQTDFKIIHEYFHLFQYNYNLPGYNSPVWVSEGSADYYGQAIGLMTQGISTLNSHRAMLLGKVPRIENLSESEFVDLMKTVETDQFTPAAYYLGSMATEVLVSVYGHKKFIEFLVDWKSMPDCRKSCSRVDPQLSARMEKHFGISSDNFYKKLFPYLKGMSSFYRAWPI